MPVEYSQILRLPSVGVSKNGQICFLTRQLLAVQTLIGKLNEIKKELRL